jgi:hypothetical protein
MAEEGHQTPIYCTAQFVFSKDKQNNPMGRAKENGN